MFRSVRPILAAISALALYALDAAADIVIKTDGSVVEGKIVELKPSERKNKPNIVIADEAGKRTTIPWHQVKQFFKKKTPWELRAENLEYYEKSKLPRVNDESWQSHFNLGRWCKQKSLDDKAEIHLKKSYELRAAEAKDAAEDHAQLAAWCEKYGLLQEATKEYLAAYVRKKRDMDLSTARGHNDLARWCEGAGLDDQAFTHYQAALKIDPADSVASAAVKKIEQSDAFKARQLLADYAQAGRAWSIPVGVEDDADMAFLEEWKKKMQELSQYIWEITEGQFFIADCVIEDQTSNGRIRIEAGKKDWKGISNPQGTGALAYCTTGSQAWKVTAAGKNTVSVLCHELFHGAFELRDEYYQNPQCECIMRSAPNPQKLCRAETHIGGGQQQEPCCATILRRYKDVRFPNPDYAITQEGKGVKGGYNTYEQTGVLNYKGQKLSSPPPTKFTLIDN